MNTEFSKSFVLSRISLRGEEITRHFDALTSAEAMMNFLKEKYAADDYEIYEVHKKLVWPLTS